ncbi:Fc receptor-like protein 5 [Mytilus trossulus]|uniref:Fc receptor-like protein 5 n=1 Tax=Mytilus trossulus TaxID=6551 RepID=UPI0030046BCD
MGIYVHPALYEFEHFTMNRLSVAIPEKNGFVMDHHYLTIQRLTFKDDAWYYCMAHTNFSVGSSPPIDLTIIANPKYPVVNIESNRYVVTYGSSLTINCSVRSSEQDPVNEIYWKYNNKGIITKISEKTDGISGSSIRTPSLTILKMTSSESGIYTCYARNDIGTGESRPINVIVTGDVPTVYVKGIQLSTGKT